MIYLMRLFLGEHCIDVVHGSADWEEDQNEQFQMSIDIKVESKTERQWYIPSSVRYLGSQMLALMGAESFAKLL